MTGLIRERTESTEKAERHDLLSLLVESSQRDKESALIEQDVMGKTQSNHTLRRRILIHLSSDR